MEAKLSYQINLSNLSSYIKLSQGIGPEDEIKQAIKQTLISNCTLTGQSDKEEWTGSGFHVGRGYIATVAHVAPKSFINSDQHVTVTFDGKQMFKAKVVISDESNDVALLYCHEAVRLPSVELGDSDHIEVGDTIAVISSPEGWHDTATVGRIINKDQDLGNDAPSVAWNDMIFIDADILGGSSGGAVVGIDGKVYGLVLGITGYQAEYGQGQHAVIPINRFKSTLSPLSNQSKLEEV